MRRFLFIGLLAPLCLMGCQNAAISAAEAAVKEKLTDPYSAKFEKVEVCPASDIVHGQVNAKNRFGAYAGSAPFYVVGGVAYLSDGRGPQQASDLLEARFFDSLSRECFFGDGTRDLMEFSNSYDAAGDSVEKYYRDAARGAK